MSYRQSTRATTEDLVASYAGLLGLASVLIYAGSFGGLKTPRPEKRQRRLIPTEFDDESDTESEDEAEVIGATDASLYPVFGSMALFGMWWVMQKLGKEIINEILAVTMGFGGVLATWKTATALTRWMVGPTIYRQIPKYKVLFVRGPMELLCWKLPTTSIPWIFMSFIPTINYLFLTNVRGKKSPLWTVVLSITYAYSALSTIKLDSFRTGIIMLGGLFLYDIWWVFGTTVMVDVATNIDIPIKLLWPKSLDFSNKSGFSMLGLGDVIVPGLFIALALRYDQVRFLSTAPKNRVHESFPKPYFISTLTAYVVGLATTMGVMHYTKHAQPALLYLSPACALAFLLTALARGELKQSWEWNSIEEPRAQPSSYPTHPIYTAGTNATAPDTTSGLVTPPIEPPVAAQVSTSEDDGEDADAETAADADSTTKLRKRVKKRRA